MSEAGDYIAAILGSDSGWMCIGQVDPDTKTATKVKGKARWAINQSTWFQWPEQEAEINAFIDSHSDEDLYMPPMLFNDKRRIKSSTLYTPCLWVDMDTANPDEFDLTPTIILETSPGRHQGFWLLTDSVRPDWAESMSRKITYSKRAEGSDTGWNLGRYMRIPGTTNTKYADKFTVKMLVNGDVYTAEDIERVYGRLEIHALAGMERDLPSVLPNRVDILAKIPMDYNLQRALMETPTSDSWSETLWWLECELFRMKLKAVEVFVMVNECACDKYHRESRPRTDLWKEILRAELAMARSMMTGLPPDPNDDVFELEAPKLINGRERSDLPRTFIDDYVEWTAGKTHGDRGYQEFSAMCIMSTVLGDFGYAVPSFGVLKLNMWFMIMGVTTRTYKTTAKKLMLEILHRMQSEHYDYDLGSDATAEGLIVELADRPDRSVLFHRDEANALFMQSKGGKNYMVGFTEFLTEAFDGHIRGRIRSTGAQRKTPAVDSVFNNYMLGVPEKLGQVLQAEDFASGFLPRFLFVLGRPEAPTDTSNHIRQIMPDDESHYADPERSTLVQRMLDIRNWWGKQTEPGEPVAILLDDKALLRFNAFVTDLDNLARKSKAPDMFEPSVNRMNKAALKLTCLLAMMDKRRVANTTDVLIAITYCERWYLGLTHAISIVGRNAFAQQVQDLVAFVRAQGIVSFTQLRRRYGNMKSREWIELLEAAVEQRFLEINYEGGAKTVQAL